MQITSASAPFMPQTITLAAAARVALPPGACFASHSDAAQNDEAEPKAKQLHEGPCQRTDAKELASSILPLVMVHADFFHFAAAEFELAHQFGADGAAGGGQADLVEQRAADQPVIAVDVA